jgi:transcriptional regulator with XRE-family HTH domain
MNYHHGQTIREFRKKRGISAAELARLWPDGGATPRYVQRVESGRRNITDQDTLRQLSDVLDIPLWCFGLSVYNPFNPQRLPGYGERIYDETLVVIEELIQYAWYLRRAAPLIETEKVTMRLNNLLQDMLTYFSPPLELELRLLRQQTQIKLINAVVQIERNQSTSALAMLSDMHQLAKQLGDPAMLAMALSSVGTELERAGRRDEAIDYLEGARDVAFDASKQMLTFVYAYLARAYAGNGDASRFQRTIDTAQRFATNLGRNYGDGTDLVYHRLSGILAERSYGYLEIQRPEKTLELRDEITQQIEREGNTWLRAWIPLDWAKAYFMQREIEASMEAGLEFLRRAQAIQSPHAVSRAYEFLMEVEDAGYADVQAVKEFREELRAAVITTREE